MLEGSKDLVCIVWLRESWIQDFGAAPSAAPGAPGMWEMRRGPPMLERCSLPPPMPCRTLLTSAALRILWAMEQLLVIF